MREFCIDDNLHLARYSMQFYPISLSTPGAHDLGVCGCCIREGKRRQKNHGENSTKYHVVVLLLHARSLMRSIDLSQHSP
jgi:hypothetical protein